jgi:ornithine cyclodeaminase
MVVLSAAEVRSLLPMAECIEVMAGALAALARGEASQPLRHLLRPPGASGLLGLMPSYWAPPGEPPAFGLKAVGVFAGNPARGLDAHQGAVLLLDGETGQLQALLDASAVTAIRTAAVSALATRLLARDDAGDLALIGAGVEARTHLTAMAAVRALRRVRVASLRPERARAFATEMAAHSPVPIEAVATAEAAVRGADLIVTATSSREPVLRRDWVEPGAHLNAVGACFPAAREIDTATVVASSLFVDRRESTLAEAGDYLVPAAEGAIGPGHIRAELGEVLVGRHPGRSGRDEITLFKSLGIGIEDLAVARFLHARALERGLGQRVSW